VSSRRTAAEARALLQRLLEEGETTWTKHAKRELAKDELTMPDAVNVMRGGIVQEPEWENGQWRYRVRTPYITVVVAFDGEDDDGQPTEILVVTAWKEQRR
jgi:hypothetical protein